MAGRAETLTFYDAKQQSCTMRFFVSDAGTIAQQEGDGQEIATSVAALSNSSQGGTAGALRGHGPFTSPPVPVSPGTIATYLDTADKAVIVFQDANGGLHKYEVACPKSSIFLPDAETVDFTNPAVKQFVADMTNTMFGGTAPLTAFPILTRQGVALTAAVGGYRRRVKAPRKFNIYTRNTQLTGGGGAP